MENNKLKLTGVFIPVDILINDSLSPFDKMLLSYITAFNDFYQKNDTIAKIFGVSIPTVSRSIKALKAQNFIAVIDINGQKRVLKSLVKMIMAPNQFVADPNQIDLPIYNKLINKLYKEKNKKEKSNTSFRSERQYSIEDLNKVYDNIEDINF